MIVFIKKILLLLICLVAISGQFCFAVNANSSQVTSDDCGPCEEVPADLTEMLKNYKSQVVMDKEIVRPPPGFSDVLVVFSMENCQFCRKLTRRVIPQFAEKFHKKIYVKTYYLNNTANYEKFYYLVKDKLEQKSILPIVIGSTKALYGTKEIERFLELLLRQDNKYIELVAPPAYMVKSRAADTLKSMTLPIVILAGLIDGINPCAFATIIFLITYLSVNKVQKKRILLIGTAFAIGVFTLYFIIGIGLFDLFSRIMLQHYSWIKSVKIIISGLMFLFFLLSLYDLWVFFYKKDNKEMLLQLPKSFKLLSHSMIRVFVNSRLSILFAFFLGFVISSIELACTGQVYFPTIAYLIKNQEYFKAALFYLLIYNIAFIAPLITVFIMIYLGTNSRSIEKLLKEQLWIIKLLLAILFFVLAVIFLVN